MGVLVGSVCANYVRLRKAVRCGRRATDFELLALLERCRQEMGVRAPIRLVHSKRLEAPALFGWVRPALVLPERACTNITHNELRHIFLHELAHVRRHDVLLGLLTTALHTLHWFNPVIRAALRRLRDACELACDELALSRLGPGAAPAYGHTIVRQVERLAGARWRPTGIGLCGGPGPIRERIAMIAGFDSRPRRPICLAILLVVGLAGVGLTDGLARRGVLGGAVESILVPWEIRARKDLPTTHQDRHGNIQRACIRNLRTGKYLTVDGETVACEADEPGHAGLWELRFDEVSNAAQCDVYVYSVAAQRYLTSDAQGNLAVDAVEPVEAARWGTWPRPEGVWLISHYRKDGYLCWYEGAGLKAWGRDAGSYWDVHSVWRVKTSNDPRANPEWQRAKIPGPD
jgi:hypothetical protein